MTTTMKQTTPSQFEMKQRNPIHSRQLYTSNMNYMSSSCYPYSRKSLKQGIKQFLIQNTNYFSTNKVYGYCIWSDL